MEKKIVFGLIFLFVLSLYFPVLGTYFTGDDFFHFKSSLTDGSAGSFLSFFKFIPFDERGYAFYRPIFRELLYFSFYNLFGLNQLPFRCLQFVTHFGNIILVFVLINRLFKNKKISYFSAFFFGITAANVGSLYYLAGGIQAQGATFFMLLTILLFWQGKSVFSFLTFLLAISSHELAVTTPIILSGIVLIRESSFRSAIRKAISSLWPYYLVVVIFLFLNVFVIGLPKGEIQYSPSFNPKTVLNTLSWYFLWALGVPEMLVDFVGPGFSLNPNLMKYWGEYFRIIFPSLLVSISITSLIVMRFVFRDLKILRDKRFWLLVAWFPIALLPVLFLPIHKKAYYLQPALPAFWGAIGYLVFHTEKKYRILLIVLNLSLVILSLASAKLGEKTYWAAQRGKISANLISDIKKEYPMLPKSAKIYIKNDPTYPFIADQWGQTSTQAFLILSGSDALQLIYGDPSLRVYYEDMGEPPNGQVFEITARIPH